MIGICADPGHPEITAQSVLDTNSESVSIVLRLSDNDLRLDFCRELVANGVKILGIVTEESVLGFSGPEEAAAWYVDHGWAEVLSFIQLLNEPDLVSDSSNTMSQLDALTFVYAWLAGWGPRGSLIVLVGGFASGDPSWMDPIKPDLLRVADGVAIHAYGQRPSMRYPSATWGFGVVDGLVNLYKKYAGIRIYITEFGGHVPDFASEHDRAVYTSKMLTKLRSMKVASWLFCLGPMVWDFDIVDTESYAAYVNSF